MWSDANTSYPTECLAQSQLAGKLRMWVGTSNIQPAAPRLQSDNRQRRMSRNIDARAAHRKEERVKTTMTPRRYIKGLQTQRLGSNHTAHNSSSSCVAWPTHVHNDRFHLNRRSHVLKHKNQTFSNKLNKGSTNLIMWQMHACSDKKRF